MAFSGAGAGILGDPYQITTWTQFKEIATNLNSHFLVMNDIVATNAFGATAAAFTGVLDGGNKSVSNVIYNGTNPLLFYNNTAIVKNISLIDISCSIDTRGIFGYSTMKASINTTFSDIVVTFLDSSTGNSFCPKMDYCTITNLTFVSKLTAVLGLVITNSNFTNVLIQSYTAIKIGAGTTGVESDNTWNICKFLVAHISGAITTYKPLRSTYTDCLYAGGNSLYYENYSGLITDRCSFVRCSFIFNLTYAESVYSYLFGSTCNANFDQCYFGGKINYIANDRNYPLCLWNYERDATSTDCLFEIDVNVISTGIQPHPAIISFRDARMVATRNFSNSRVISNGVFKAQSLLITGTDNFINRDYIDEITLDVGVYTKLTSAQTLNAANFTNFDFDTVWQINEGVSSPILRNAIMDAEPYMPPIMIDAVTLSNVDTVSEKASIVTIRQIPDSATLKVYVSDTIEGIEAPENLQTYSQVSDTLYESIFPVTEGYFYVKVVYQSGDYTQDFSASDYHCSVAQVPTTVINIPVGDFITMASPKVSYVHGTVVYNGYLYGSARTYATGSATIFKLNVNDYSDVAYQTIFLNKVTSTTALASLDQIVFHKGFLWCLSTGAIVRINPTDLDYMVFSQLEYGYSLPIGADEDHLFIPTQRYLFKILAPLNDFASYGYDGTTWVTLPAELVLFQLTMNQVDPDRPSYIHSIIIDANYIYAACTVSAQTNGWLEDLGVSNLHLQKINKHTMVTAGDVTIPKCTDDMMQNDKYIFLTPEMVDTDIEMFGSDFGLLAIKKSNLQIKYLKALHKDHISNNESDRATYGVQYFGNYMLVQMIEAKTSIVISTENIDNWGTDFPVGGATVKMYSFLHNGINLSLASNELSMDANGVFHANTWTPQNTTVYKFIDPELEFIYPPNVQSVLVQSLLESTTIGGYILSDGGNSITENGLEYGTDPNNLTEIITNELPLTSFQSILNLTPGIYYFRAWAVNSVGTGYGSVVPFIVGNAVILSNDNVNVVIDLKNINSGLAVRCCKNAWGVANGTIGTATDIDGNEYETVVINEKEWFTKDLMVTKYNNGDTVPEVTNNAAWAALTTGALCAYNNNWDNV